MLLSRIYRLVESRQAEMVPFFYSTQFLSGVLTASANVQQNIGIQSDSHFICRYLNVTQYITGGAGGGVSVGDLSIPMLINLFDTGSGRTLMDNPQALSNITGGAAANTGNGNLPFIFPEPWLIRAGGTVQVTLQNIGNTTVQRCDVALVGFKLFKFGQNTPADIS